MNNIREMLFAIYMMLLIQTITQNTGDELLVVGILFAGVIIGAVCFIFIGSTKIKDKP